MLQTGAAEACGYTIKWANGEVTKIRLSDIPQSGCTQQKVKFNSVQLGVDSAGNRVKTKWSISVKCARPGCETKTNLKIKIRKKVIIKATPSALPSVN